MKISIVIPLYNLEGYIEKCVRSTLDQDLAAGEYEVIVVDDGSTDGSYAAASRAAQGHPNVHVYTKPNEGLGMTRNYGTDRAAGRYVVYLDADDYLEPRVLGRIADAMERDALDMLCIRLRAVDDEGAQLPYWSDRIYARYATRVQSGKELLRQINVLPMVPVYVYDREFLNSNSLRMKPIWHEDEEFTPRALCLARRISYLPDLVYNYLQRSDSFMGDYKPEKVFNTVPAMQSLAQFAQERENEGDAEGAQLIRLRIGLTSFLLCKRSVRRRYGNTRELIRRMRAAGLFPLSFPSRKFRYMLLNFSPSLFILYYRLHGRQR